MGDGATIADKFHWQSWSKSGKYQSHFHTTSQGQFDNLDEDFILSQPALVEEIENIVQFQAAGKGMRSLAITLTLAWLSVADLTLAFSDAILDMLAPVRDETISTGNDKVIINVANGCARLVMKLHDYLCDKAISAVMAMPTLQHARLV